MDGYALHCLGPPIKERNRDTLIVKLCDCSMRYQLQKFLIRVPNAEVNWSEIWVEIGIKEK